MAPPGGGVPVPVSYAQQESGAAQSSNLSQVVSVLTGKGLDVNAVGMESGYKQSVLQKSCPSKQLYNISLVRAGKVGVRVCCQHHFGGSPKKFFVL